MTPAVPALAHQPLLGILLMCAAGSLFPVMNGVVQLLSPRYSTEQIVWVRTAGHLLIVLALFMPRFGAQLLMTQHLRYQIGRSIFQVTSTAFFFAGVAHLPLAKAAAINFTTPIIVVLLAWPMLGERINLPRLAAAFVAFAGVLIVIRPGSEVFQWVSLLILGSSASYALYQVFTRRVAGHDRPETSVVYSALVGTLVLSLVVGFNWQWPLSRADGWLMISLGLMGALGHYCVAKAMIYAPANVVAPFMYWQMIGSVIVGYLVSGSMPDFATWLGAAIIIGAGLYLGWRETREERSVTVRAA